MSAAQNLDEMYFEQPRDDWWNDLREVDWNEDVGGAPMQPAPKHKPTENAMNTAVAAVPAINTLSSIPAIGDPLPGGVMAGFMPADGERRAYLIVLPPLNAAPTPRTVFGPYVEVEGLSDWDGAANTQLLVARDEDHPAAKYCAEFEHDGFKDYYLMSNREASVCCAGARLFESGWHWTSTQYSAYTAFLQYFAHGYQYYGLKASKYLVRPVRRIFIDSSIQSFSDAMPRAEVAEA